MIKLIKNETISSTASSLNNEEITGESFFKLTQLITGLYLYPIFCIFGLFGNFMNFIIYQKSKKYSTNLYLIALALSDIVKLLNDMLYFVVNFIGLFDKATHELIFHKIYRYSHYIFVLSAVNTSWLTCAIAFDRYVSICKHFRKKPFNNSQSVIIIFIILLCSMMFALPSPMFSQSVKSINVQTNKTDYSMVDTELGKSVFKIVYGYLNGFIRVVIPLIVLVVLNFNIIRYIYKAKQRKAWLNVKPKTRSTQMLLTIVIIFLVCIFPDAIMTMMQFGYASESYIVRGFREITDFLLLFNSASTFPICFYFSIEYREKLKELFTASVRFARKENASVYLKSTINDTTFRNTQTNEDISTLVPLVGLK